MKRMLMSAAFTGLVAIGSYAVAQSDQPPSGQSAQSTAGGTDYSNSGSSNKPETMKQCMARQKATNSGLTHEAMQTTCKNEMKQQKLQQQGQDLGTGTQNGSQTPPKD
jgi:hypothetical protein